MLIVLIFAISLISISIELQISDTGVFPPKKGDIALLLYLTVQNGQREPVHVVTKATECCQIISTNDSECKFMKIRGGDMGILKIGERKNLTFIYPTLYLHDREGECLVVIWYRCLNSSTMYSKRQRIHFDTKISLTSVPPLLKDYYTLDEAQSCSTVDLDPLDKCNPVNCEMKYSGSRNYFNTKLKICQKVPICIADDSKELPDVAYNPNSNTCKNLETQLTAEEMERLSGGRCVGEMESAPAPHVANIRCHHGHVDNITGFCICDKGWTSVPDQFSPSTSIYHMCTVQIGHHWPTVDNKEDRLIIYILGGSTLLAIFYALLAICCHLILRRSTENDMYQEISGDEYEDDEDDCLCSR